MPKRYLTIYLSGSIKKGKEDNDKSNYWTSDDEEKLIRSFSNFDETIILNPSKATVSRQDFYANFGCDLHLVSISDVVIADVRERRGIGIGAEMTLAKMWNIPVVSICPNNTYYKKSFVANVCGEDLHDWTHPFVFGLSDVVVDNLEDAITWIRDNVNTQKTVNLINDEEKFKKAISYYLKVRETLGKNK